MTNKTRMDRWKDPDFIDIPLSSEGEFSQDDDKFIEVSRDHWKKFYKNNDEEKPSVWNSTSGIMKASRELIFNHDENNNLMFHVITYSLNIRRGQLQVQHGLDLFIEGETPEEVSEEMRRVLAFAHASETPVLPNTDELAEELASYYRELMIDGFNIDINKGKKKRFKLVQSPGDKITSLEHLKDLTLIEPQYSADIAIIREVVEEELSKLNEAQAILSSLDLGIKLLKECLLSNKRNEGNLQKCLTAHPVLFGFEYREVIPQHRLGSEFVMDFALKHSSGLFDLLEIDQVLSHYSINQEVHPIILYTPNNK